MAGDAIDGSGGLKLMMVSPSVFFGGGGGTGVREGLAASSSGVGLTSGCFDPMLFVSSGKGERIIG